MPNFLTMKELKKKKKFELHSTVKVRPLPNIREK